MALILTPRQLSQRAELYHQLGQLTAAGIGVIKAVEMLGRNPPSRSFRGPLQNVGAQLAQGATFSDSLQAQGHWTPAFDIALIRAGENSGRLDAVFKLLGDNYEDRARLLRQMLGDLAYPVFVLHFAVFLFPFLEYFAHNNLPLFLLKSFGVLIPVYVLVFGGIYATQGRRGASWRSALERLLRPVPVLGAARHSLALSRLAAALDALLNAGVTVIEAWDLAAAASGSPALARAVAEWRPRVVAGETPADAVGASRQFPEVFANLYRTGEASGQLDETLRRLHTYYHEEGTRKLRFLAQWAPRMVYFGVAILVAYRIIGFYMDYFNQVEKAGGF